MTKKEIEKLIDYVAIKGCFSSDFKGYSKMYSFTTENISGFINKLDLNGKKVLTVAGSGDQRLNCYLNGASDVTCFDVNPLAEFQLKLKDTALATLSHRDFLRFFGMITENNSIDFFDSEIFDKIKSYLDDDVYMFYNYLVNEFRRNPFGNAYYEFDYKYGFMRDLDNYLGKESYKKLSNTICDKDINFLNVNIANLPEVLDGEKFDLILLSNISDYIHLIYPECPLEHYKEVIDKLVDNLNLYGIIQVGYIYSRYTRGEDVSRFHLNETRNRVFPNYIYHSNFVNSFYHDGTYDKIITYQKLK